MKRKTSAIIIQILIISLISVVIGFSANSVRSDGIPIIQAAKERTVIGVVKIELAKAKELYDKGKAIFIDTRTPGEYQSGHILNAHNLPYEEFDTLFLEIFGDIDTKTPIVAYCSGEGCHSSDEIARLLLTEGYLEVYVFFGGWPTWVDAKYPTSKTNAAPLYSLE